MPDSQVENIGSSKVRNFDKHIPIPIDIAEDEKSVDDWTKFLNEYADGGWCLEAKPYMPYTPQYLLDKLQDIEIIQYGHDHPDVPLYSSTNITPELARRIRDFFCHHGYLPPPRAPLEDLRERVINEYDLWSADQHANIQEATNLLSSFFPGTLCSFSLFSNRIQRYHTYAGPQEYIDLFSMHRGKRIPAEDSFCGHAVLSKSAPVFVGDSTTDWRYRYNPYARQGIRAYVGTPITLDIDPSGSAVPRRQVAIGTLNLCYINETREAISPKQYEVIGYIARMLQTTIRATWDGHISTRDARIRRMISDYVDEVFTDRGALKGSPPVTGSLEKFAQMASDMLHSTLPEMEEVHVWDLRGRAKCIGSTTDHLLMPSSAFATVISNPEGTDSYHFASRKSGLEPYLRPNTRSHLVSLAFVDGEPIFAFLATSQRSRFPYTTTGLQTLRSMASFLRSKAIQDKVKEANAAKTAFLSSISHELRTPLHGVSIGLDLIRDAMDEGRWQDARQLLNPIESSAYMLENILNDVLDFGKDAAYGKQITARGAKQVNLLESVKRAINTCARLLLSPDVTLKLEHEARLWNFVIDEARVLRIIVNGLTNAMKFCKNGSITVQMTIPPGQDQVKFVIRDTGIGIHPDYVRSIFQPFTKGDPHSPGAGLGLHLTRIMVEEMNGTIDLQSNPSPGAGDKSITEFTVNLPVDVQYPEAPSPPMVFCIVSPSPDRPPMALPPTPPNSVSPELSGTKRASFPFESTPRSPELIKASQDELQPSNEVSNVCTKVLVVDDNRICRKLLCTGLQRSGFNVCIAEAADGKEAVDKFRSVRPDLVVTDVSMPIMDGITAAGIMRDIEKADGDEATVRRSRIYALTGLGSSDPRLKAVGMTGDAALDGWLAKGQNNMKDVLQLLAETRLE